MFAVKVMAPEVVKQLVGYYDIMLRLRRPDCSDGSYGHTVAYKVSYCTVESNTGELC